MEQEIIKAARIKFVTPGGYNAQVVVVHREPVSSLYKRVLIPIKEYKKKDTVKHWTIIRKTKNYVYIQEELHLQTHVIFTICEYIFLNKHI